MGRLAYSLSWFAGKSFQLSECLDELRSKFIQLAFMFDGERVQKPFAFGRQFKQHAPAVFIPLLTPDEARFCAAVTQLHGSVVAQTKPLSRKTHCGGGTLRCSRDLKQ